MSTDLERELHDTLHATGNAVDVADGSLAAIEARLDAASHTHRRWPVVVSLAAAVAVIAGIAGMAIRARHDVAVTTQPLATRDAGELPQAEWSKYPNLPPGPRYDLGHGVVGAVASNGTLRIEDSVGVHLTPHAPGEPVLASSAGETRTLVVGVVSDRAKAVVITAGRQSFRLSLIRVPGAQEQAYVGVIRTEPSKRLILTVEMPYGLDRFDSSRPPGGNRPEPNGKGPANNLLAATASSLAGYALSTNSNYGAGPVYITRLDESVRQHTIVFDEPGSSIAVAGERLFVGSPKRPELYELDAIDLLLVRKHPMPEAITALAGGPHELWVATEHHLLALEPDSLAVLVDVPIQSIITSIAIAPQGDVVYDLVNERQVVEIRRGSDGQRLAAHALNGPGAGNLTAAPAGVWTAYPTGNLGAVTFLAKPDLKLGPTVKLPEQMGSNNLTAVLDASVLWIFDRATGELVCSDPSTGRVRNVVLESNGDRAGGVISASSGNLYVGTNHGMTVVKVAPQCR
jgi:hypothetical protein